MDVTSINNCYEEDGLVLVRAFLDGLNAEALAQPNDPLRRVLVAVLPEFKDDGRIDRLNFMTCPKSDPGLLSDAEIALMDATAAIVEDRKRRHAEAVAKLEQHPIGVVPFSAAGNKLGK